MSQTGDQRRYHISLWSTRSNVPAHSPVLFTKDSFSKSDHCRSLLWFSSHVAKWKVGKPAMKVGTMSMSCLWNNNNWPIILYTLAWLFSVIKISVFTASKHGYRIRFGTIQPGDIEHLLVSHPTPNQFFFIKLTFSEHLAGMRRPTRQQSRTLTTALETNPEPWLQPFKLTGKPDYCPLN